MPRAGVKPSIDGCFVVLVVVPVRMAPKIPVTGFIRGAALANSRCPGLMNGGPLALSGVDKGLSGLGQVTVLDRDRTLVTPSRLGGANARVTSKMGCLLDLPDVIYESLVI